MKNGNFSAFQTLVFRHDRKVFSIAARYVDNAEDAKDIYQEVFIRAYRGIGKFKEKSEFTTWLYRITTNVCISFYRSRKRYLTMSTQYENSKNQSVGSQYIDKNNGISPHRQMRNTEISARVANAVNLLSPQQKLVFTMRHYDGHKLHEIASFLKCSEGAVKKQLFIAIRKLRGELKDLYLEGVSE
ncbi:MAG: RNA polymerase sigma factor [Ignavibacteriales bacterium]|nr:RNA polymerase sigma factor [Ignavibacteriales bacterium]